ncbi:hypothetical protein [Mycetocola saprophilus]|uniref:hypothetical protein n=1 Tax=Mycetocola saprophilus TaxID=76636 RepID=UPI003BF3CD5C
MSALTNIDVTLRDGGYRNGFDFDLDYAKTHAKLSVKAGFDWVEIAYLKGSFNPALSTGLTGRGDLSFISEMASTVTPEHVGIILHPKNVTEHELSEAYDAGARLARICVSGEEIGLPSMYVTLARRLGFVVTVNFTRVSRYPPRTLAMNAYALSKAGAQVIYLADSNGALTPREVTRIVGLVEQVGSVPVGFHAHNHLGLAMANAIAAVDAGATWIDASVQGMGKGAGNLVAEQWLTHCEREDLVSSVDLAALMDVSVALRESVIESAPLVPEVDILLGRFDLSMDERAKMTGDHRMQVATARRIGKPVVS